MAVVGDKGPFPELKSYYAWQRRITPMQPIIYTPDWVFERRWQVEAARPGVGTYAGMTIWGRDSKGPAVNRLVNLSGIYASWGGWL